MTCPACGREVLPERITRWACGAWVSSEIAAVEGGGMEMQFQNTCTLNPEATELPAPSEDSLPADHRQSGPVIE